MQGEKSQNLHWCCGVMLNQPEVKRVSLQFFFTNFWHTHTHVYDFTISEIQTFFFSWNFAPLRYYYFIFKISLFLTYTCHRRWSVHLGNKQTPKNLVHSGGKNLQVFVLNFAILSKLLLMDKRKLLLFSEYKSHWLKKCVWGGCSTPEMRCFLNLLIYFIYLSVESYHLATSKNPTL